MNLDAAAPGTNLGWIAAALVFGPGLRWLWLMRQVRIPRDRTAYVVPSALGAAAGAVALAQGTTPASGVAAALALAGGALFVLLCAASAQSRKAPAVTVGGPVVDFTATDQEGRPFATATLRGRPFLLKFFRGHWCPYCVAELRRWNELRPVLDAHGIAIVTVCADTPAQIRAGRARHGLEATMLADPDLAVTDLYHLRNPRNFAPKPGLVIPLPVPTTILVDAAGTVRWIDQAEDYMVRSDPGRVLAAIEAAFGARPAAGAQALPLPAGPAGPVPACPLS